MVITVLRTFCIVASIMCGTSGFILYFSNRNAKRLLWFAILSCSFAISTVSTFFFDAALITYGGYDIGNADNIYLMTYTVTLLCTNMYTDYGILERNNIFHNIFNYILFAMAIVCLVVSNTYVTYSIVFFLNLAVLVWGIVATIKKVKERKKYDIFLICAYGSMLTCSIISIFLYQCNVDFLIPRLISIPLFLIFHIIRNTCANNDTAMKAKKLSDSLQTTIERIQNSDNALMCTQMKADFLYRSLELISRKCDEDPFTAEDLTVSLSKYLRHTLNFQQLKGIVPLSNEIELTKAYIAIEKERNTAISFEYRFPDPLPEFHVPPLSIQPLVENAICHAFDETVSNPKVTITIISYRDYFHIDVSDNGVGMDEKTVSELTEVLHDSARIGIYNINNRLINLFGKGLVIQSAKGVGTSVSFVVPPDAVTYLKEKAEETL